MLACIKLIKAINIKYAIIYIPYILNVNSSLVSVQLLFYTEFWNDKQKHDCGCKIKQKKQEAQKYLNIGIFHQSLGTFLRCINVNT